MERESSKALGYTQRVDEKAMPNEGNHQPPWIWEGEKTNRRTQPWTKMLPHPNGKLMEEAIEKCWDDGMTTTLTNKTTLIGESTKEITDTWPANEPIITMETLTNKSPEKGEVDKYGT